MPSKKLQTHVMHTNRRATLLEDEVSLDAPVEDANALAPDAERRGLRGVEDSGHGGGEHCHNDETHQRPHHSEQLPCHRPRHLHATARADR